MKLGISVNSWHYKFYKWNLEFWGLRDKGVPSLCKYCQVLFWGSALSVALCIPIGIGYFSVYFSRFLYESLSKIPSCQKFIDRLDDKCNLYEGIQFASKESEEHTGQFCLRLCGLYFLIIIIFFIATTNLPKLFTFIFLEFLPILPFLIYKGLLYTGFGLFWAMSIVGLVETAFFKILWFIGASLINYAPLFIELLLWFCASSAICYGLFLLLLSKPLKPLRKYFSFKVNGFQEAYKNNQQRRTEKKEAKQEKEKKLFKLFTKISEFFGGTTQKIGDSTVKLIGGFGIAWHIVKAFVTEVCPLVDFVDDSKEEGK